MLSITLWPRNKKIRFSIRSLRIRSFISAGCSRLRPQIAALKLDTVPLQKLKGFMETCGVGGSPEWRPRGAAPTGLGRAYRDTPLHRMKNPSPNPLPQGERDY